VVVVMLSLNPAVSETAATGWREISQAQSLGAGLRPSAYRDYHDDYFVMRAPEFMPKPLPPRRRPLGSAPLPFEGCGVGPVAPPPTTAVGGEPKVSGDDGIEAMYCEKPRQ